MPRKFRDVHSGKFVARRAAGGKFCIFVYKKVIGWRKLAARRRPAEILGILSKKSNRTEENRLPGGNFEFCLKKSNGLEEKSSEG